jgi:transposase-like protein
MDKSGKRGKIPQSDWPLIMARYEGGETLSSIARTYDCSPPAISYIVSRSKAKPASEVSPPSTPEAQLIKAPVNGATANGSAAIEPTATSAPVAATPMNTIRREPVTEPRPNGLTPNGLTPNGLTNGAAASGDQRRTLHLSLGGGEATNGSNGNGHAALNGNGSANGNGDGSANGQHHEMSRLQPQASSDRMTPRPAQPPFDAGRYGRDPFAASDSRPQAQQPRDGEAARKDNSAFIDQELRSRVDGDIAAFLAAFDAALAADTQENRFGLREATDRLLRAGARTRIELERLEARVPLSPREGGTAADAAAWRQR